MDSITIKEMNEINFCPTTIDGIDYPLISEFTYEGLLKTIQENQFPEYRKLYETARQHFENGQIHCLTIEKDFMGPSYIWITSEQKQKYEAAQEQ